MFLRPRIVTFNETRRVSISFPIGGGGESLNPLAKHRVERRPVLLAVFVQGGGGQRHRGDGLADAVYLHARQLLLLALRHQAVELGGAVADQSSQVAHKLVDEALALHLADHVAVVVVPVVTGEWGQG